jgi:hypothetical protein
MDVRRAFGPHKRMNLSEKARNVAQAIVQRERQGQDWRWNEFGLENNEAQIRRVWDALVELRAKEHAHGGMQQ